MTYLILMVLLDEAVFFLSNGFELFGQLLGKLFQLLAVLDAVLELVAELLALLLAELLALAELQLLPSQVLHHGRFCCESLIFLLVMSLCRDVLVL